MRPPNPRSRPNFLEVASFKSQSHPRDYQLSGCPTIFLFKSRERPRAVINTA